MTRPCKVPHCKGAITYVTCNAKLRLDTDQGTTRGVFRHSGNHDHGRPPINIPDKIAKKKFRECVLSAPATKPLQLKVGVSDDAENPLSSVRNINESLRNVDRIAYHRKKELLDAGILTGKENGDGFIETVFKWHE